jgi:hypothetical protein
MCLRLRAAEKALLPEAHPASWCAESAALEVVEWVLLQAQKEEQVARGAE